MARNIDAVRRVGIGYVTSRIVDTVDVDHIAGEFTRRNQAIGDRLVRIGEVVGRFDRVAGDLQKFIDHFRIVRNPDLVRSKAA